MFDQTTLAVYQNIFIHPSKYVFIKICSYIHEDRRRFEHERQRLAQALERNNQLTRTIAAIIPEFAAVEREMQVATHEPRNLIPSSAGHARAHINLHNLHVSNMWQIASLRPCVRLFCVTGYTSNMQTGMLASQGAQGEAYT